MFSYIAVTEMASEVETQGDEDCNDIGDPSGLTIEGCTDQYLAVSERGITSHLVDRLASLNSSSEHRDLF